MSTIKAYCRFRPLREEEQDLQSLVFDRLSSGCFNYLDNQQYIKFEFEDVLYDESSADVFYQSIAQPIVEDAFGGVSGAIVAHGQTGAGRTESVKALLSTVTQNLLVENENVRLELSMLLVCADKVRDLLGATDEVMRKTPTGRVAVSKATIAISSKESALETLNQGRANMEDPSSNIGISNSDCVYIFSLKQRLSGDEWEKLGTIVLVDLARSNTSINELVAYANGFRSEDCNLRNVVQHAVGKYCKIALLCCCSPNPSDASETLTTLLLCRRFLAAKTRMRVRVGDSYATKLRKAKRWLEAVERERTIVLRELEKAKREVEEERSNLEKAQQDLENA